MLATTVKHLGLIAGIMATLAIATSAQPQQRKLKAKTYTIASYPDGLSTVPCEAFAHIGPNAWAIGATIKAPNFTDSFSTHVNDDVAKIIEAHCGKKH
jgi:hypothetical protein